MKTSKTLFTFIYIFSAMLLIPQHAYAMHIMEGFLPVNWAAIWFALAIPFIFLGLRSIQKTIRINPSLKMLLGLAGAFVFVLSSLKIPSVTGSCSHPTGVGLGAIMFGPMAMSVLSCIVLVFQALLLGHGGVTTLGANTFSMGVVGPVVSYAVFITAKKSGAPIWLSVFLAAALGNLFTYITTSVQLALAFPDPSGGILASLTKFLGVFAVTQVPLAISEGILTIVIFNVLMTYNKEDLVQVGALNTPKP